MDFVDYVEEEKDEAVLQKSIQTAKNMLKRGKMTLEEIAEDTELPLEKIEALSNEVLVKNEK